MPIYLDEVLKGISNALQGLKKNDKEKIKSSQGIVADLVEILDKLNVLFVESTPRDQERLRVHSELRVINECLKLAKGSRPVAIPFATCGNPHGFPA